MNSLEDTDFERECEKLRQERAIYKESRKSYKKVQRFFEYLSVVFGGLGFITLALIPFTEITLLHATCMFVIHYTIQPTDLDHAEAVLQGVAEDIAHIRANLVTIRNKS